MSALLHNAAVLPYCYLSIQVRRRTRWPAHQTESPQFQVLRGCGACLGESRGAHWPQQLRQSHRPASLGPVDHRPATLAGEAVGAPEPAAPLFPILTQSMLWPGWTILSRRVTTCSGRSDKDANSVSEPLGQRMDGVRKQELTAMCIASSP